MGVGRIVFFFFAFWACACVAGAWKRARPLAPENTRRSQNLFQNEFGICTFDSIGEFSIFCFIFFRFVYYICLCPNGVARVSYYM